MGESTHSAFEERMDWAQWHAACFEKYFDNGETCMGNIFKMAQSQHRFKIKYNGLDH